MNSFILPFELKVLNNNFHSYLLDFDSNVDIKKYVEENNSMCGLDKTYDDILTLSVDQVEFNCADEVDKWTIQIYTLVTFLDKSVFDYNFPDLVHFVEKALNDFLFMVAERLNMDLAEWKLPIQSDFYYRQINRFGQFAISFKQGEKRTIEWRAIEWVQSDDNELFCNSTKRIGETLRKELQLVDDL